MGLVAWAFVGGALLVALAALVGHALGWQRARRRAAGHLEVARQRVTELETARAGMEARDRATVAEGERWRCTASDLEASLADVSQEKTRLDYELRQVGLAASRVPQLEQHAFELSRTQVALADTRRRLGELESVAAELDLREQYIESLQRALSQRDERVLTLEQRVDQLIGAGAGAGAGAATDGLVPAEPGRLLPPDARAGPARPAGPSGTNGPGRGIGPGVAARPAGDPVGSPSVPAVPAGDPADPDGAELPHGSGEPAVRVGAMVSFGPAPTMSGADGLVGAGRALRRPGGAERGAGADRRPVNGTEGVPPAESIAVAAAAGPAVEGSALAVPDGDPERAEDDRSVPGPADEETEPNGSPPVGRALQQALNGLGVRSFADLGLFDPGPDEPR